MARVRRQELVAVAALLFAGCASQAGGSAGALSPRPLKVAAVEADRAALNGRPIAVVGFLSKIGENYFLSDGRLRPANKPGENGETYWCIDGSRAKPLWVRGRGLSRGLREIQPKGDRLAWAQKGRRVVVRGVLKDRNSPEEALPEVDLFNLVDWAVGPLADARIVRILPEFCDAAPN